MKANTMEFKQAVEVLKQRVTELRDDSNLDVTSVLHLLQSPAMHVLIKGCTEQYQRSCAADLVQSISRVAEQVRTVWLRRELLTVERLCDHALDAYSWHENEKKEKVPA